MKIAISSGHGLYVRGAEGPEPWGLDEVDEARKVANKVAELYGAPVFHDNFSNDQSENLNRIVDWHNGQTRDLDISIHFNAYDTVDKPMGTECLFLTQEALAKTVSTNLAAAGGFINRGPKKRSDLFFLNKTDKPAILIEVCFVDSKADTDLYRKNFDAIAKSIVTSITGGQSSPEAPTTGLDELLYISPVVIYGKDNGQYIRFVSDLDICNDGSGPSHGDPHHQSATAYYNNGKYLNADVDKYIVIPPQVRMAVPPVVMGCQGRLTNLITGVWHDAVTGEIGPGDKTGEAAYCLAKIINPAIDYNSGDKSKSYLYELWPGKPAVVDGKTYKLEKAGG